MKMAKYIHFVIQKKTLIGFSKIFIFMAYSAKKAQVQKTWKVKYQSCFGFKLDEKCVEILVLGPLELLQKEFLEY